MRLLKLCILGLGLAKAQQLESWLNTLIVHVPRLSLTTTVVNNTIRVDVENIQCRNIQLDSWNSAYIPPKTLEINPTGIGTTCNGEWKFEQETFPHMTGQGNVGAVISDGALNAQLTFPESSDGLMDRAVMESCEFTGTVGTLDFSGTVAASVLDLFKGMVKTEIEKKLQEMICPGLTKLVETNLTQGIHMFNDYLRPALAPEVISQESIFPAGSDQQNLVDLTNTDLMDSIRHVVNNLLGSTDPEKFNEMLRTETLGPADNAVIKGEKILDLYEAKAIKIPDWRIGHNIITLSIPGFNITDLDTWSRFDLLTPVAPQLLHSVLESKKLSFAINFTLGITQDPEYVATSNPDKLVLENENPLAEKGMLDITLANNQFNITNILAIYKDRADGMSVDRWLNPGCASETVHTFSTAYIKHQGVAEELQVRPAKEGKLETEVSTQLNNIVELITTNYPDVLTGLINKLVTPAIANKLNEFTGNALSTWREQECEPEQSSSETRADLAEGAPHNQDIPSENELTVVPDSTQSEPEQRAEPVQPAEPTRPAVTTAPVQAAVPLVPVVPAESVDPEQPVVPVQPVGSAQSWEPAEPSAQQEPRTGANAVVPVGLFSFLVIGFFFKRARSRAENLPISVSDPVITVV